VDFTLIGTVDNVFTSTKSHVDYVTISDVESGGQVKVSVDSPCGVKEGQTVRMVGKVRGKLDNAGGVYLRAIDGKITAAKVTIE
jgi:hypothetical protein